MSSYTEGQVHQLMERLENAGFLAKHLTLLGQYKNLGSIRDVLECRSEIKPIKDLVDLDANPFTPLGWTIIEHKKGGKIIFHSDVLRLQETGLIQKSDLIKKIKFLNPYNTNMLDHLLNHPELIHDDLKNKITVFYGTHYRDSTGSLVVRYLYWNNNRWSWSHCGLEYFLARKDMFLAVPNI